MARTLKQVRGLMEEAGIADALTFTAAFTDGENLWAYRWACDGQAADAVFPRGQRQSSGGLRAHRRQDQGLARGAEGLQPRGARRQRSRSNA